MDNQTYLNQISAKPLKAAAGSQNKFLNHTMIKLIAGLLIAITLLIVVISTLGQSGARTKSLTETFYARMSLLSENKGPIVTYSKDLFSSDLRALTSNLRTNLVNLSRDLEHLLPDLGIDAKNISAKVTNDEAITIADLTATLETARLNSLLDRTFSSQMTLELAKLRAIQSELYERASNQAFRDLLQRAGTSLETLEIEFTNFTNSH